MSNITGPLSINDGLATPVARSFAPVGVRPELSVFSEKTATQSAGYKTLTVGYSPASGARKTHRVDFSLSIPTMTTVEPISVARTALFKGYFVIPDTCTAAERADLVAFVANALDNTQLRAVVKDLDPLY